MKQRLLFLITLLPGLLLAQQKVAFPEDFSAELNGKEVTITNTLTLSNNYSVFNSGSVTLSAGTLWIPTEKNLPGKEMFKEQNTFNAANQITLAKGNYSYVDINETCRIGQTVTGLTGTIKFSNGKYTITPTQQPVFIGNERPIDCGNPGNYNLKVASFNVENYSVGNEIKRTKVVAALKALNADIYALVEILGNEALQNLCSSLNTTCETQKFKYILNSNTKQSMGCFIYDSEKVTPYKVLQKNQLANNYLPDRKVAQAFELNDNNERIIICLNHWKAKAANVTGEYAETGDGQGSHNTRRLQEAEATLAFINSITTYFEDPDVLIVGDLNSYTQEDPIRKLTEGGLINQLQKYAPTEYSYAYYSNGSYAVGYLDHSFATPSLDKQISTAKPFRINADEPGMLDNGSYAVGYLDHSFATPSLDKQISTAKPFRINADEPGMLDIGKNNVQKDNMYRCSDHNPIVTAIQLDHTVGISDAQKADNLPIEIYGNPCDGYLTLKGSNIERVEILNINGQSLISQINPAVDNHFVLSLEGLKSGFYLIRTYNNGHYSIHKIALQ